MPDWKKLVKDNRDTIYEATKKALHDSAMNIVRETYADDREPDERRRLVVINDSGEVSTVMTDGNDGPGYLIDEHNMVAVHVSNKNKRNGIILAAAIMNSIDMFTETLVAVSMSIIDDNMGK